MRCWIASSFVLGEAMLPFKHVRNIVQSDNREHEGPPSMADFLALKAKVVGIQRNASHAQAGNEWSAFDVSCPTYTGGSCMVLNCDEARGQTECGSGYHCGCARGFCADGHGRCLTNKPAVILPGTFKIKDLKNNGYLYMKKWGSGIESYQTDPGKQGHWHVVVFNDGSIGLTPEEWKYDYWMTMTENCDEDENDDNMARHFRDERCDHDGSNVNQYAESFEPYELAWELYAPEGKPEGTLCMKHIRHRRFANMAGSYVDGHRDAYEGCMLQFEPPLVEEMKRAKAEIRLGNVALQRTIMDQLFR